MKNLQNNGPVISSDALKSGAYAAVLPELYEQKDTVENNPWHDRQSVFDHTVSVVSSLEHILAFDFLYKDTRDSLRSHLSKHRFGYAKTDVSLFVAMLHDIGKKKTLKSDPATGRTDCPGHEKAGGPLSRICLSRMGVDSRMIDLVSDMVAHHGDIHEVVNRVLTHNELEKEFARYKSTVRAPYILYVLQGYADTMGSDLPKLNPKEYKKREMIYREAINRFTVAL